MMSAPVRTLAATRASSPASRESLTGVVQAVAAMETNMTTANSRPRGNERAGRPADLVRLRVEAQRRSGVSAKMRRCFNHCQHCQVQVPVMLECSIAT